MSDVSAASRPARRTPWWLLSVLVVSLLLNGLIAGAFASRWGTFSAATPWPGSSVNAHLVGYAVTLPDERRREILRSTESLRAEMRPIRKVMQDARDRAREALVASPFDPQRFEAEQKRLFDAEQQTRLANLKVIQAIAERLTPQERNLKVIQAIAERLTPQERAAFAEWETKDRGRRQAFWRKMREDNKEAGSSIGTREPPDPARK